MTKKILVADDDPIIIKLMQVNLELEGYEVVCARDGQDAVEKAQAEQPDLIILDIMMPRMDGWSARAALLEIPALRDTPVIFVSARAQQADLRKGYESGVAKYITKPFDPMELLSTIESVLSSSPKGSPDTAAGSEAGSSSGAATGADLRGPQAAADGARTTPAGVAEGSGADGAGVSGGSGTSADGVAEGSGADGAGVSGGSAESRPQVAEGPGQSGSQDDVQPSSPGQPQGPSARFGSSGSPDGDRHAHSSGGQDQPAQLGETPPE